MPRPKCNMCRGTGKREHPSFVDARKMIKSTCTYCHGHKVVPVMVDIYDVIEWLHKRGQAQTADAVEKQWGAPTQDPFLKGIDDKTEQKRKKRSKS